ncbi:MAG: hypothetical protein AAGC55_09155 [Myxococcota bacterium]
MAEVVPSRGLLRVVYLLSIIAGAVLIYFAIPKLMAMPVSVAGFTAISQFLGWDSLWFMYFTGAAELIFGVVLLIAAAGPLFFGHTRLRPLAVGNVGLAGIMLGAIGVELVIRPGQANGLLILAIALLAAAAYNLSRLAPRLFAGGIRGVISES